MLDQLISALFWIVAFLTARVHVSVHSGSWLVSRRVFVPAYGSGTVYAFNKTLGFGASSHDIQFDADPEGQVRTIKLRRCVRAWLTVCCSVCWLLLLLAALRWRRNLARV